MKKIHFSTTSCEKGQKLKIVGEIIAFLQKQLQKIVHFKKLAEKEKKNISAKQVCISTANLNKNHVFQKIDREKREFFRFW